MHRMHVHHRMHMHHRMHVHPPPPQPERLVMRKDEAVGNKKKIIKIFLKSIKLFSVQFQFYL
jgi:hypothetical protein